MEISKHKTSTPTPLKGKIFPECPFQRNAEINEILTLWQANKGLCPSYFLLEGESGIGKSSIAHYMATNISGDAGVWLLGKCAHSQIYSPFSALKSMFDQLASMLFLEREDHRFVKRLSERLGGSLEILVQLCPKFGRILKVPPISESVEDPFSVKNRLLTTLLLVLQVICEHYDQVALVVDDIQWADLDTLELLGSISKYHAFSNLAILATTRTPFSPDVLDMGMWHSVRVPPFSLIQTQAYVSSVVGNTSERCDLLGIYLFHLTQGNVFFLKEVIGFLISDADLTQTPNGEWTWDLRRIQSAISDRTPLDLIRRRLSQLSEPMLALIAQYAILGFEIDHWLVSYFDPTGAATGQLIAQGLLIEDLHSVRFIHDQLHKQVRDSLDQHRATALHLTAAIAYRSLYTKNEKEGLFAYINHIKKLESWSLVLSHSDAYFGLLMQAAQQAQAQTAYQLALQLYQDCDHLISQYPSSADRESMTTLYTQKALCLCYLKHESDAISALNSAKQYAKTIQEHGNIVVQEISIYMIFGRYADALEFGLRGLAKLGCLLPTRPSRFRVLCSFASVHARAWRLPQNWTRLPKSHHAETHWRMAILSQLVAPAFEIDKSLMTLIIVNMMSLVLKYGIDPNTPFALSAYGLVLSGGIGWVKLGDQFGKLGIRVSGYLEDDRMLCRSHFVYGHFIRPWVHPINSAIPHLETGYQLALQSGQMVFAHYASTSYVYDYLCVGRPLSEIRDLSLQFMNAYSYSMLNDFKQFHPIMIQLSDHLVRPNSAPMGTIDVSDQHTNIQAWYGLARLMDSVIWENWDAAMTISQEIEQPIKATQGGQFIPQYYFYSALAYGAILLSHGLRKSLQKKFIGFSKKLARLSRMNADNYGILNMIIQTLSDQSKSHHHLTKRWSECRSSAVKKHLPQVAGIVALFEAMSDKKNKKEHWKNAATSFRKWGAISKADIVMERMGIDGVENTLSMRDAETMMAACTAMASMTQLSDVKKTILPFFEQLSGATHSSYLEDAYAEETSHGELIQKAQQQKSEIIVLGTTVSRLVFPVLHRTESKGTIILEIPVTRGISSDIMDRLRLLISPLAAAIDATQWAMSLEDSLHKRTHALKAVQAKVVELEKSKIEKRLSGAVAHEIRNALSGASMANLAVLTTDFPQVEADDRRAIARIGQSLQLSRKAFDRSLHIIENIQEFTKPHTLPSPDHALDLGEMIRQWVSDIAQHPEYVGISIKSETEDGHRYPIYTSHVESILSNLVANAKDALVGTTVLTPIIHVALRRTAAEIQMIVTDNGPGIDPVVIGTLFDAFVSTKPLKGMGLGLSIVKKICQLYDGDIHVYSELNVETTFTVTLPMRS